MSDAVNQLAEYNHGISGALENAIHYHDAPPGAVVNAPAAASPPTCLLDPTRVV
jgi:NAD(P)H-dependent FMN reductase